MQSTSSSPSPLLSVPAENCKTFTKKVGEKSQGAAAQEKKSGPISGIKVSLISLPILLPCDPYW